MGSRVEVQVFDLADDGGVGVGGPLSVDKLE